MLVYTLYQCETASNQPTNQQNGLNILLENGGGGLKERVNESESQRGRGQASSHSSLYWACRVTEEGQHRGGAPDSRAASLSDLAQLLREASCVAVTSCQVSHP